MFWKDDEEEEKVVTRTLDQEDREVYTTEEFQSSDETGAEERFESRIAVFQKENKPVFKHHFWWFVHNCVAHPAIGVYPCKKTFDFHDWTSKKINAK